MNESDTCTSGISHVEECVHERTSPDPDGRQNNQSNIWTGRTRMRADGSKSHTPLERDDVDDVLNQLVDERRVFEWHGLLAPATEEHLRAIIENERKSGTLRKALIGEANAWIQSTDGGNARQAETGTEQEGPDA
jgi:hypothetical protein